MRNHDLEKKIFDKVNTTIKSRFESLADVDLGGYNILMRSLARNHSLRLNEQEIDYLIKNSDLEQRNNNGFNALMLAVIYYAGAGLNKEQLDYLIKNSDLKQISNDGRNSLGIIFKSNQYLGLNLGEKQLDYLIKNSDLKQSDVDYNDTALMLAFKHNDSEKLKLKRRMFSYLIKNSDLSEINGHGWNALMSALCHNKEQKLDLSTSQWNYLIKNSDVLRIGGISRESNNSVLGLTIKNEPDLIDVVFQKAINDKNFNLDNYKNDEHYKEICEIVETYKTKQSINNTVKNSVTNKYYKI